MCKHVALLTCAQACCRAQWFAKQGPRHLPALVLAVLAVGGARSHPVARPILRVCHYGCYCYLMFDMCVDACIVRCLPSAALVIVLRLFVCLFVVAFANKSARSQAMHGVHSHCVEHADMVENSRDGKRLQVKSLMRPCLIATQRLLLATPRFTSSCSNQVDMQHHMQHQNTCQGER